jgi:hypothetical protein
METGKRLILHTEADLVIASVAAGAEIDTAITVVGAEPGHVAMVSAPSLEGGLIASAFVSDVDEVTIRVSNVSAGGVDPADQDFIVAVTQD